jgi:processive 1,2-diacylglycerol beta-glucosyltransferase
MAAGLGPEGLLMVEGEKKKKIVFAMIEAGGGHKAPAKAIMDALAELAPNRYELMLSDLMKDLDCVDFDREHKNLWDGFLERPLLTTFAFYVEEILDPISRFFIKRYPLPFVPYAERWLKEYRPDVIVSTHFLNSFALIEARKRSGVPFTLVTCVSDAFGVYCNWIVKETDYLIAYTEESRKTLIQRGVSPEKIRIMDYPVNGAFFRGKRERAAVRAELGIEAGRKALLVSFGAQGFGGIDPFLRVLERAKLGIDVIVVTGRNEALNARLEKEWARPEGGLKVRALGFVSNMNELIEASDFCFIKPGSATTMEVLLSRKPVLFYSSVSPNERWNTDFAVRAGVGFRVGKNPFAFLDAVKALQEPGALKVIERRYEALAMANGDRQIAAFIDKLASGSAD